MVGRERRRGLWRVGNTRLIYYTPIKTLKTNNQQNGTEEFVIGDGGKGSFCERDTWAEDRVKKALLVHSRVGRTQGRRQVHAPLEIPSTHPLIKDSYSQETYVTTFHPATSKLKTVLPFTQKTY